jgi:glutathione S-transferase
VTRILYTSWISTFARKVALGLELKGLAYEAVDALRPEFRAELKRVNPRAEVPVLLDDDLVIVNSSDILQYLDWRYPEPALHPQAVADRVVARALERLADQRFDPLVVDCSFWHWTDRKDQPPPGLLDAAQRDLGAILQRLETELAVRQKPWPFGVPGVVECAWFPNLAAVRAFGLGIDATVFPHVLSWLDAMRRHPVFVHDRRRTAVFLKTLASSSYDRTRLFWSGDRIEWLFAHGFHDWFAAELKAGRVVFPD